MNPNDTFYLCYFYWYFKYLLAYFSGKGSKNTEEMSFSDSSHESADSSEDDDEDKATQEVILLLVDL